MSKKNISNHDAAIGKYIEKQGCRWLCVCCHVKNKQPTIHGSGTYCLPTRHKNASEPLEWSVYIEYWPYSNFFMGESDQKKQFRMNEAPPVPTFSWNGPVWWESVPKWIFFNLCGCSTYHGTQIWFPRLQNLSKLSIYVWHPFPYNHLGWFMKTKNIGTHNAALGKKMWKTRLEVVMYILSKNKEPIHSSDR